MGHGQLGRVSLFLLDSQLRVLSQLLPFYDNTAPNSSLVLTTGTRQVVRLSIAHGTAQKLRTAILTAIIKGLFIWLMLLVLKVSRLCLNSSMTHILLTCSLVFVRLPLIQVWPSIGGWSLSDAFVAVASSESSRKRFAASCVALLEQYSFDGIDIDWEVSCSKNYVLLCICVTMSQLLTSWRYH